jgi:hypothetical protein
LATWAVVAFSSLTKLAHRATQITQKAIFGINALLYAYLILIIILFNFNAPSVEKSCGNRVVYPISYTKQKEISVAYSAILAGISLLMGLGFLGLGLNLHFQVNNTRKMLNQGTDKKVKLTSKARLTFF